LPTWPLLNGPSQQAYYLALKQAARAGFRHAWPKQFRI